MNPGRARNHEKVVGWVSVPAMILKWCVKPTIENQMRGKEIGP